MTFKDALMTYHDVIKPLLKCHLTSFCYLGCIQLIALYASNINMNIFLLL